MGPFKSLFCLENDGSDDPRRAFGWGGACLCLALAVYSGTIASGDGWAYFIVALKLLAGQTPTLPPDLSGWAAVGIHGLSYSKHGLGFSLLLIPFLALGSILQILFRGGERLIFLQNMALLVGPLVGGAGTGLMYLVQRRIGFSPTTSSVSTLFFLGGGLWLTYTRHLFTEATVAVMLLLMIYGGLVESRRGDWMTGISSAFLVLLRVDGVLLVAPVVAWLLWKRRRWTPYIVPMAVGCGIIGLYNGLRFGWPWSMGMGASPEEQFSTPLVLGLFGQFFAAGNGLFLYAPYLFVPCVVALIQLYRGRIRLDPLWVALLLGGASYLVLHSKWYSWMGGWSWGPRRVIPLLPFFHLLLAGTWDTMSDSLRSLMVLLLVVSLLVNAGGLAGDYRDYYRGTFYRTDVLFTPVRSQIVQQNLGMVTGRFPVRSFWTTSLGSFAGAGVILTWVILGFGMIVRVWPESP